MNNLENKKNIVIAVVVILVLLGFLVLNKYIYNEKQADFVVGTTVETMGTVLAVDSDQIAFDGPYVFTLEAKDGALTNVAIPSMGLPMCEAYKARKIGDVSLIKVGDEIEVKGVVGEDGSVVPCESDEHYFKPVGLVVGDFEGEADPNVMKLTMKTWIWQNASYNDGRIVTPKTADKFTLTFKKDGTFSASTDCNGVGGEYVSKDSYIVMSSMISTLMFCEGSQESEFRQLLENTTNYYFTSKGELVLSLKFDSGTIIFK